MSDSEITEELEAALWALSPLGDGVWSLQRTSLYDEEGVEGWRWDDPEGGEHYEVGDWQDLPPVPTEVIDQYREWKSRR